MVLQPVIKLAVTCLLKIVQFFLRPLKWETSIFRERVQREKNRCKENEYDKITL